MTSTSPPANPVHTWRYSAGSPVAAVAIDAAGETIVAGTLGKTVVCLDGAGQQRWQAEVGNQAWRVAVSADGQTIVAGTGSTRPWDLPGRGLYCFDRTGSGRWQLDLEASVWGLALAADGRTIAAGTDARQLLLLDELGRRLWQHHAPGWGILAWVFGAALSADGETVAATLNDRGLLIMQRSGLRVAEYRPQAEAYIAAVSADGTAVATGDMQGHVYWLDRQGRLLWRKKLADAIWAVVLSADGQRLLVGAAKKEGHLWAYDRSGQPVWQRYVGGSVSSLALSADGRRVVAGTQEGGIYIFGADGVIIHQTQAGKKVRDVAISASGQRVVAGSEDGFIYGFQLSLGEPEVTGLSSELYQRSRQALLQCHEFTSDAALRAVLVTAELRPFQSGLPEARSPSERVDLSLNFLLSRRLRDGRPLLPLFLAALRDRYESGDTLRDELAALAVEVERALASPTGQGTPPVASVSLSPGQIDPPPAADAATVTISGDQINFHGPVGAFVKAEQVTLNLAETSAGGPNRLNQAKRMLAHELLAGIASLDARLDFVETTLAADTFEQRLSQVRQQVAPALQTVAAAGYRHLLAAQQLAGLRQALNSRPLRLELGQPLIQVLVDSGADPSRFFYDQLAQVHDVSESLLAVLADIAAQASSDEAALAYQNQRLDLARETLHNRSATAHAAGLRGLHHLRNLLPADALEQLAGLKHLTPPGLPDDATIIQLLAQHLQTATELHTRRAALLAEDQHRLEQTLAEYDRLNQDLVIQAGDLWNIVVAQAISLRQLGRTTEAVAAFARYGDMFAAADPTASNYARVAQQFTLQLEKLGLVDGAVYIFDLVPQGAAALAGLKVGDILVELNGQPVRGMADLVSILHAAPTDQSFPLTYLRLEPTGRFLRQSTTAPGVPLGASFRPV